MTDSTDWLFARANAPMAVERPLPPAPLKAQLPLIARIGRSLYGEHWHSQMARVLGVSQTSIRNWERFRPKPKALDALAEIIFARASVLLLLHGELERDRE